jgi:hypothetical protein
MPEEDPICGNNSQLAQTLKMPNCWLLPKTATFDKMRILVILICLGPYGPTKQPQEPRLSCVPVGCSCEQLEHFEIVLGSQVDSGRLHDSVPVSSLPQHRTGWKAEQSHLKLIAVAAQFVLAIH